MSSPSGSRYKEHSTSAPYLKAKSAVASDCELCWVNTWEGSAAYLSEKHFPFFLDRGVAQTNKTVSRMEAATFEHCGKVFTVTAPMKLAFRWAQRRWNAELEPSILSLFSESMVLFWWKNYSPKLRWIYSGRVLIRRSLNKICLPDQTEVWQEYLSSKINWTLTKYRQSRT